LTLAFGNSTRLLLRDSASGAPGSAVHTYSGWLPTIQYHVVERWGYEDYGVLLVNARTGWRTHTYALPVPSPDSKWLAVTSVDLDARYIPTKTEIWHVQPDSLVLNWERTFAESGTYTDNDWGLANPRWLSATRIMFQREYRFGARGDAVLLALESHTWNLEEK
jgi:hypothetical protein